MSWEKIKSVNSAIRSFLQANKIYFEVVVASCLTFMALYLSWTANKISEQQTTIMQLEHTPNIELRKTQIYNDSLKIYDVTKWFVYNNNSKISNFDIEKEYSLLCFSFKQKTDTIKLPVWDYLNLGGTIYENSEGKIFDFDNKYSGYEEYSLRQSLFSEGYLDVESYIKINYRSVLKKNETKYFRIEPGIEEIDSLKWNRIKFYIEDNSEKGIHLGSITTYELKRKLKLSSNF